MRMHDCTGTFHALLGRRHSDANGVSGTIRVLAAVPEVVDSDFLPVYILHLHTHTACIVAKCLSQYLFMRACMCSRKQSSKMRCVTSLCVCVCASSLVSRGNVILTVRLHVVHYLFMQ